MKPLMMAGIIALSIGCGRDARTPQEACRDVVQWVQARERRCARSGEHYICAPVAWIRDIDTLYGECRTWLESAPCTAEDFPAACLDQLGVE